MKASFDCDLRLSLALHLIVTAKIVFGMPGKKPTISMHYLPTANAYITMIHA